MLIIVFLQFLNSFIHASLSSSEDSKNHQDFDEMLSVITGDRNDVYQSSSKEFLNDIKRLFKYYKKEMDYRQCNEPFKIESFFLIIQELTKSWPSKSAYFSCPALLKEIEDENDTQIRKIIPDFFNESFCDHSSIPCFPEISLFLFKNQSDPKRRTILLVQAFRSALLFEKVLKYLTVDVYKVPREELWLKMYPDFPGSYSLDQYYHSQEFMKLVFIYQSQEAVIATALLVLLSVYLQPCSVNYFQFVPLFLVAVVGLEYIFVDIFLQRYHRFEDPGEVAFKKFNYVCCLFNAFIKFLESIVKK